MNKPVYSTATGSNKKQPSKKTHYQKANGPCKIRLETKGRGGKSVTVLFNLPLAEEEARQLMKELQNLAGCGATFKDAQIELQGDRRELVESYFQRLQMKIIRAGG